jgi:hypothetical protein
MDYRKGGARSMPNSHIADKNKYVVGALFVIENERDVVIGHDNKVG